VHLVGLGRAATKTPTERQLTGKINGVEPQESIMRESNRGSS
jgi:hypothetical protein